jgi:hypothetical protein
MPVRPIAAAAIKSVVSVLLCMCVFSLPETNTACPSAFQQEHIRAVTPHAGADHWG